MNKQTMSKIKRWILSYKGLLVLAGIVLFILLEENDLIREYNDSLMVFITSVYVGATILICRANIKSAKATKAQVDEAKRQFDETQRLQAMPYLQLYISEGRLIDENNPPTPYTCFVITEASMKDQVKTVFQITLKNVGLGMLHKTKILWNSECRKDDGYPEKDVVIPPHVEWKTNGLFVAKKAECDIPACWKVSNCTLLIEYQDLLGNRYSQNAKISFIITDTEIRVFYSYITSPVLVNDKEAPHA